MFAFASATVWTVQSSSRADRQRSRQVTAGHTLAASVAGVLAHEAQLAAVIGALQTPVGDRWPVFSRTLLDDAATSGAGLIVPVSEQQRAAYERAHHVKLVAARRPGVFVPAPHRREHSVLDDYVHRPGSPPGRLGFDLSADPIRRATLAQASVSRAPQATPPVRLLIPGRPREGVVVFDAIRGADGRLRGWVTASYRADLLLASVRQRVPQARLSIVDGKLPLIPDAAASKGVRTVLPVGGRRWTVMVWVPAEPVSLVPWLILLLGVVCAVAIGLFLRASDERERYAQRVVDEHVAEHLALRRIAELVAQSAGAASVFDELARQVLEVFGCHSGVVARFDERTGRAVFLTGITHDGRSLTGSELDLDGTSAPANVYRTRVTSRTSGAATSGANGEASTVVADITDAVAAPIVVGGRLWGCLATAFSKGRAPADTEERLARFADLVAMAVANAEAWDGLAHEAATDPLTGLANHRAFHERLRAEVKRARRHGRALSVALLDLDHFKEINDTFGHPTGDKILAELGRLFVGQRREEELVGRIGGEEFAWVMPETDARGAYGATERMRQAIESHTFPGVGTLTISVGICSSDDGADGDELMRAADLALYWAKDRGRNRSVLYTDEAESSLAGAPAA